MGASARLQKRGLQLRCAAHTASRGACERQRSTAQRPCGARAASMHHPPPAWQVSAISSISMTLIALGTLPASRHCSRSWMRTSCGPPIGRGGLLAACVLAQELCRKVARAHPQHGVLWWAAPPRSPAATCAPALHRPCPSLTWCPGASAPARWCTGRWGRRPPPAQSLCRCTAPVAPAGRGTPAGARDGTCRLGRPAGKTWVGVGGGGIMHDGEPPHAAGGGAAAGRAAAPPCKATAAAIAVQASPPPCPPRRRAALTGTCTSCSA